MIGLTVKSGTVTVSAPKGVTTAAFVAGLEDVLKKARKASAAGRGLESLNPRATP